MTVTRIAGALVFAVAWLANATAARAADAASPNTVVLVTAGRQSALAAEATVRLGGELAAARFNVRVVEAPADADPRATLEQAAADGDVVAVVAIFADSPGDPIQLWVIDRVTGKTVIRSVPAEADRSAERLSVRARELLEASFLELALEANRRATEKTQLQPPPPQATEMVETAIENRSPKTWAIEVGGCVLRSFEGVPLSLAPMARVERAWGEHLETRVTLAGLGTRARVYGAAGMPGMTSAGSASVAQDFGLVEVGVKLRPEQRLRPFFSLGVGVLHAVAEGLTTFPNRAQTDSLWTPVADAGAGARLIARGRFEVALELHAQLARDYPTIRFVGNVVARSGRPNMIASLTLLVWL